MSPAPLPQHSERDGAEPRQSRTNEQLAQAVYLTPAETVLYLGLPSRNALKQRMKRGTIPAWTWTRMGGTSLRFLRASLDEWLQPKDRAAALRLVHGETVVATSSSRKLLPLASKKVASR